MHDFALRPLECALDGVTLHAEDVCQGVYSLEDALQDRSEDTVDAW